MCIWVLAKHKYIHSPLFASSFSVFPFSSDFAVKLSLFLWQIVYTQIRGAVWSGSILFASEVKLVSNMQEEHCMTVSTRFVNYHHDIRWSILQTWEITLHLQKPYWAVHILPTILYAWPVNIVHCYGQPLLLSFFVLCGSSDRAVCSKWLKTCHWLPLCRDKKVKR